MQHNLLLSDKAITYTWRQLTQRVGLANNSSDFTELGISVHYTRPDQIQPNQPGIIVVPCNYVAWGEILHRPPQTLDWLTQDNVMPAGATLPFDDPIPVLFWGAGYEDGNKPFAEKRKDGSIIFYADIIAAIFFMLSRWEETVANEHNEHGRFPAVAGVAYKQGFLNRPIVDEYALILRAWVQTLRPQWNPTPRRFSVKLSHDIDVVKQFTNIPQALRMLAGDLFKRSDVKHAQQTIHDLFMSIIFPSRNNYINNIYELARLSAKYKLNSAFYFMAAKPAPYDNGYNPASPLVRRCIKYLQQQGFEIGFHPGYHTFNNPEKLAWEKSRLDAVLGETRYGGRQHYLRFQAPDTWRHWEEAGLSYDSTVGYADCEGFRCGTCHSFQPFDITQNRELNLQELPLIVMDATLYGYRKFTAQQSQYHILTLAQKCKQVEGTFTLLWHNTSSDNDWLPGAALYQQVIKALKEMEG